MHESTIDIDTKLNTVIQQLRTIEDDSSLGLLTLENIKDELENCETMMGIANNGVTDIDMDTLLFLCYRPFHEESNEA